jgi:hypothetical protein
MLPCHTLLIMLLLRLFPARHAAILHSCLCFVHLLCHDTTIHKEGMGLLEYHAMPSLRDVAHDRWLCTFIMKQQQEIPSARSWAAPVRASETVQPVHHVQNESYRVTPFLPARRAAVLGQPSSLRPHWYHPIQSVLLSMIYPAYNFFLALSSVCILYHAS